MSRAFFVTAPPLPTGLSRNGGRKPIAMSALKGRNAVITGASRGIGRGIALGFGELGANVFITGRRAGPGPGSLEEVAGEVRAAGGNCEYFVVDHSDDEQVALLFEKLKEKLAANGSTLDVFVNNAYAAVPFIGQSMDVPFWKKSVDNPAEPDENSDPGKVWDVVNAVGLRNHYVCAVRAMRIMEKQKSGTVVNITSWAGMISIFDTAYSVGKEAIERMSSEMALNGPEGVSCFSFCPGYVTTEELTKQTSFARERAKAEGGETDESLPPWNAETPLFVGRALAALMSDKGQRLRPTMQGKVVVAAEVANKLKVYDENNFQPLSFRSIRFNALFGIPLLRNSPLRFLLPRWLYAPWPVVRLVFGAKKFWN